MVEKLLLYSKENCHLCDVAKEELVKVQEEIGISFQEIDIYKNDELLEAYGLMIPVVQYKKEIIQYGQVSSRSILAFLNNKK